MRKIVTVLGVTASILLAGCSSDPNLEASIAEKNIRVDTAITRHKEATKQSDELKSLFVSYLETQDNSDLESFLESKIKDNNLLGYTSTFSYMKDSMYDYVSMNNVMADEDDTGTRKKITDIKKFVEENLLVESFLNDSKGSTEQLFYLTLKDSQSYWISVYWIGGSIIDVKTGSSI